MSEDATTRPANPGQAGPATGSGDRAPPVIDSADLFGSATEIAITHADAVYRLRITRQGKLILNK
jgi:hemin uptake protein HemP